MKFPSMDQILFMQAGIANMYMKKHRLSPGEFLKLDKKLDILGFIHEGYEPFHLMGDKGILNEVEYYIRGNSVNIMTKK